MLFFFELLIGTILSATPSKTRAADLAQYSIGEPTGEEQQYLEEINRARLNPSAEALRLQASTDPNVTQAYGWYAVDLPLFVLQLSTVAPAPPLSMNAQLTAAARGHSQDMFAHGYQAHTNFDGSTLTTRVHAQGYTGSPLAENVFAAAASVEQGHAAFEVDWGGGPETGGMQFPAGHRENNHSTDFREIGVGVVNGIRGEFGPQFVTEDFGNRVALTPFVTGVVYYDLNGNGSYDSGEGVGAVTITVAGSTYYAISARSGGYSVPVPGAGVYAVTFATPLVPAIQTDAIVSTDNVKIDQRMTYSAPAVTGPDKPSVNFDNWYSASAPMGATALQWQTARLVPATLTEGAENGLQHVTLETSPGYSVVDSVIKASGRSSFRLAHPNLGDATNPHTQPQRLYLTNLFRATAATQLTFATRLSWAAPEQIARAQISLDAGASWQDVWKQAGSGNAGETAFTKRTVDLAAFAGREFRLRFAYDSTGSFYYQTGTAIGFYFDDIALAGAEELLDSRVSTVSAGAAFGFKPPAEGRYAINARPIISEQPFPAGPTTVLTAQVGSAGPGPLRIAALRRLAQDQLQIEFSVPDASLGSIEFQTAPELNGPWSAQPADVMPFGSGYRGVIPRPGGTRLFWRVHRK